MDLTTEILKKIPFFEDLSESRINEIATYFQEVEYKQGDTIFREGDPGNALYIIRSGKVEIAKRIREDMEEQAGITTFGDLDFFGEMSIIDNSPRSASAIVKEDSVLLEMTKDDFLQVCLQHPKVFLHLFRIVSQRLRDTNEQFANVMDDLLKKNKLTAIGSAAAKIVHDIKTPITVIILTAQLMENLFPGTQKYVKKIVSQTYMLDDMVREILDYAKGGKIVLDIRENDMNQIFQEVIDSLSLLAKDRYIKLSFNNTVEDRVLFDTKRIKRTITNIVKNAIEAMVEPGKVIISADKEEELLHISIVDTGPGIPVDILEQLFEPFVTKGKANGTGLGLAISHKVVTDHKGTIKASNHDNGARFDIYLPYRLF